MMIGSVITDVLHLFGIDFFTYSYMIVDTKHALQLSVVGIITILFVVVFCIILDKIINYKVASCPNEIAKEEEKEKLQRK